MSLTEFSLSHSYQSKLSKTGPSLDFPSLLFPAHVQYTLCTCSVKGFSSLQCLHMLSPSTQMHKGGRYSWLLKTESLNSWPNFHFVGATQNSKSQVLTKFSFLGVGEYSWPVNNRVHSVVDPGGGRGAMPPPSGPVKISHKKDGCQRRPHRFHVSRPLPYPAAGSATVIGKMSQNSGSITCSCIAHYVCGDQ